MGTFQMLQPLVDKELQELNELRRVELYKNNLDPRILAGFYVVYSKKLHKLLSSYSYRIVEVEEKESILLETLNNCLQLFKGDDERKLFNYIYNEFRYKLNHALEERLRSKRRMNYEVESLDIEGKYETITLPSMPTGLEKYDFTKLSREEIIFCEMLYQGYNLKEVAKKLNLSKYLVHKLKENLKSKIVLTES